MRRLPRPGRLDGVGGGDCLSRSSRVLKLHGIPT
jgi:hypothetical protein